MSGMPLELVLGPANSAKAGEVLGAYAAAAHRGALLVVPTAVDAAHYSRELAGDGTVLGSVLTFAGLAREIARRAGYSERRLSGLQRERVLRRVVRSVSLPALGDAAQAFGFVEAAGNLIAELQRSLVTPQRFAAAMRSWAAEDGRREPYARDVAAIYQAYARELSLLGRADADLHAWRALDALREAPGRWGDDPVFFYGFDDLHQLERDTVETLARVVGVPVTVSLTYEAGRSALGARAQVVEELRPLAERVRELPALDAHYDEASRAALHQLERNLFEPSPGRVSADGAVRLLEAGGDRAEAELVAAEVLGLLRAGVPGEEIVVVHRSPTTAGPAIERVFEQYGIDVAIDRRAPFGHTSLGRGLLALARCALLGERARAEDLLDYLRSPGILDRQELADGLEADVRREGVRTAAQAREQLGWTLGEIDAIATAADPATELAVQARRLFASPHRGAAPVLGAAEELDARALSAMLRALAELDELGERVEGEDLIELLEGLDRAPPRTGTAWRGADLRAAGDPGAPVSGGAGVRAAGGRVPAGEHARAVPVRRPPARAGRLQRVAVGAERRRARARALPVLRVHLAGHARGRAQLLQLRRGGQPRAAVAVHRRRRRAARARLARAPAQAAAGRRRLASRRGPDRA